MDLLQGVMGSVRIWVESADLPGLMTGLNNRGISLGHVEILDDVTMECWIRREDWDQVTKLCRGRGAQIQITHRRGLYWKLGRMKKRPLLLLGLAVLLFLILFLPSRVLFVKVEGNQRIPANRILEAAEICGIRFGASRRNVRSERVKNALLETMPELQWAGVNTKGCVAVLSVRERTVESAQKDSGFVSGIIAGLDGVVISCTAARGNLLCIPGQAVRQGELLISGFTDCGLTIRAASAQGEVFALTRRKSQAVTPSQYRVRAGEAVQTEKISLLLGKKRINLWKDSGISVPGCGRMYTEYYITLPGGFQLPAAVCVEQFLAYEEVPVSATAPQYETALIEYGQLYLCQQMSAGRILEERTEITEEDGKLLLEAFYVCREMIGRIRVEQIGEING